LSGVRKSPALAKIERTSTLVTENYCGGKIIILKKNIMEPNHHSGKNRHLAKWLL